MKKVLLVLMVAMLAAGVAWGRDLGDIIGDDYQDGSIADQMPTLPPGWLLDPDLERIDAGRGFGRQLGLTAVPGGGLSVEARNSAGLFRSNVDHFIDPRWHNPEAEGNFMFVGGDFNSSPAINFGFSTTVGGMYLAFFYGGHFVYGAGFREIDAGLDETDERVRAADWRNNLAVLLGIAGMGIRLDVVVDTGSRAESSRDGNTGDDTVTRTRSADAVDGRGSSIALTWGANLGQIAPWVRVGYRFALERERTAEDNDDSDYMVTTSGGAIEVAGGARFIMSETTAVGGDIWFAGHFADRRRGSYGGYAFDDRGGAGGDGSGGIGFGLGAYVLHRVDAGPAALAFRPTLDFGLSTRSGNWSTDDGTTSDDGQGLGERWTTLRANFHVGGRVQATERISLFTGASIRLFDWTTWANTDGDDDGADATLSAWGFHGVNIGDLNLGMTFTATENIVFGLGLNNFARRLFNVEDQQTIGFDANVSIRF